jgi:nucleotide-binding universal stress UspA family protein
MSDARAEEPRARREPLRRIIVGTDFSESARHALELVPLLPVGRQAEVTLIHVLPAAQAPDLCGELAAAVQRRAEEEAALLRARLAITAPGATVGIALEHGSPFFVLAREARDREADLLIVDRHGAGGIRGIVLGSTAERVVQRSSVPVLVAHGAPRGAYGHPLAALAAEHEAQRVVVSAARLLGAHVRRLDVVHAYTSPFEGWMEIAGVDRTHLAQCRRDARRAARAMVERALRAVPDVDLELVPHVEYGDARRIVRRALRRRRSDLLVMGAHTRSGIVHALVGSTAGDLLHLVRCDVLVVPVS